MTLDAVALRVERGEGLAPGEAAAVAASHDLIAVSVLADEVRRRIHADAATFCRVWEVHVEAVPPSAPEGLSAGEVRIVGTAASLEAACAAVASARRVAGSACLAGLSLADAVLEAPDAFARLAEAGLDAIAELPVDRLPAAEPRIEAARAAGLLVERITMHDPPPDPVAAVMAAASLQRTAGGFRAFAPLPRRMPQDLPTTGYDDVKLVALARLVAREIPSIQVDWALYGPKLAQVALTAGADDLDAVDAVEAGALGPRRTAREEVLRNIRAAGFVPFERNGRYVRLG